MDRNVTIAALVSGVVGILVLIGSLLYPPAAEQFRYIAPAIVAIVLMVLGIPAAVQTFRLYTDMRVQEAQFAAAAAQGRYQPEKVDSGRG